MKKPILDRLESKITKGDGCWEWTGSVAPNGYGKISSIYAGGKTIPEMVHRVAYREYVGPIPSGAFVCHKCDNRKCVNPAHLFLGTPKDNTQDMLRKGRNKSAPRPGELNPTARLSNSEAAAIRRLATWGYPRKWLAEAFFVSTVTVGEIVRGESYRCA